MTHRQEVLITLCAGFSAIQLGIIQVWAGIACGHIRQIKEHLTALNPHPAEGGEKP